MADLFIIKKPWIAEKAAKLAGRGQYSFIVSKDASKPEIRKAIKDAYKVDVVKVNVVNRPPKRKRFGNAMKGMQEGYRKAIVTLKEGQKLDVHQ